MSFLFSSVLRKQKLIKILSKFGSIRTLTSRSDGSGYESETAKIQNSLNQFSIEETFSNFDEEDYEKTPKLSNSLPLKSIKEKSIRERKIEFSDYKKVRVKGGKGGDGMICFLRLLSNPLAGPSGGDGGNGGHVIFEASSNINSLNEIKSVYKGFSGENGMHKDMTGKSAKHTVVFVPVGTLIKNLDSKKTLADMNQEGMKFLAAKGGSGGKGNHYFLSNNNRHPGVAEVGAAGEDNVFILELKIIAHAGLVGFPNVGKSTLLSALSRARPKIASYPFTTLKPSIGIIQYDDNQQLMIADLPGLTKNAHKNEGLGIDFLKHVDRCVCLFYVVDIFNSDPFDQLITLMNELELYKKELSKRPLVIVVNKIDLDESQEKINEFKTKLESSNMAHLKVIPISAKYGINLLELLKYFRRLYDLHYNFKSCNNKFID